MANIEFTNQTRILKNGVSRLIPQCFIIKFIIIHLFSKPELINGAFSYTDYSDFCT